MSKTEQTVTTTQHAERIVADGVYTSADVMRLMHVCSETLGFWYKIGLEYTPVSLAPKAKRFVTGQALMDFLRTYGAALRIIARMREIGKLKSTDGESSEPID